MRSTIIHFLILSLLFLVNLNLHASVTINVNCDTVNKEISENINKRIEMLKQKYIHGIDSDKIKKLYKSISQEIKNAVAPFGFYRPFIASHLYNSNDNWILKYLVQLGKPVKIKKISVNISGSGRYDSKINKAIVNLPLHNKNIFNTTQYILAKRYLLDVINNQGYIYAKYDKSIVIVNPKNSSAIINWKIETNKQYYFGRLSYVKSFYDKSFLSRLNKLCINHPYSSEVLLAYQQELNQSKYFSSVNLSPEFSKIKNSHVPIRVSPIFPKARVYIFGLGYGSFTGPRILAGANFRRLTRIGHSLNSQIKLSSIFSGLAIKYYIPGNNPLNEEISIGANFINYNPKYGKSLSGTLSLALDKQYNKWKSNLSLNYLLERYSTFNLSKRYSELAYPKIIVSFTDVNNTIHPTYGRFLSLISQAGSKHILSKTSFLQAEIKALLLMSPFDFAHIMLRADLGYTLLQDLINFPLSMQYFAGGINSIRGYPDSSIGPGKYLMTGSIEYRNHIVRNWLGAIFYDTGTATNHIGSSLKQGVGIGIIYESMIGPAKLYLAKGISKHRQSYQIEFSIGPEF